jgi:hypothetical protein
MKSDRRAKVAAAATVVGLTALGGVALGTNHGFTPPAPVASVANGHSPIVTSASGSTITTAGGATVEGHHTPIVTRTSGGGTGGTTSADD